MLIARDFVWDEFWWKTRLDVGEPRLASGPVDLVFAPEGRGEAPLTEAELTMLNIAEASTSRALETAVTAIFEAYPRLQRDYPPEVVAEHMPNLKSVDDLYPLLDLVSVNVPNVLVDDPYLGFEFSCQWDPEHGAGVLVRGTRVVDLGGADTAILLWIARRDAETIGGD